MIDINVLDPKQLYLHYQLEGVMAGELELDQWGYWKNDDPEGSESEKRRVTLFEVFRKSNQGPASAANAMLFFATDFKTLPNPPVYLGPVEVTEQYIQDRFWRE